MFAYLHPTQENKSCTTTGLTLKTNMGKLVSKNKEIVSTPTTWLIFGKRKNKN